MYYNAQIKNYLAEKGIAYKIRGNNILINCPQCGDTEYKMAFSAENGSWNCLHLNRDHVNGLSGTWWKFQQIMGDKPSRLIQEKEAFYKTEQAFHEPTDKIYAATGKVLDYLHNRCLTDETIKHFKVGQNPKGEIAFPYTLNGKLVNIKSLAIERPNGKKIMYNVQGAVPSLFNQDGIEGDSVIITEGEICCMSLWQYGIKNVVSIQNGAGDQKSIAEQWDWISNFQTIIIAYDNDPAGNEGADRLANRLGRHRCYRVVPPDKHNDWNECLMAGVDSMEIAKVFSDLKDFSPPQLISPNSLTEEIVDRFLCPEKYIGIPTPFALLTEAIGGWRMGEITIWSGYNASGKTTMLNQVVLGLCAEGHASCIASLELKPERYLQWMLYTQMGTRNPSREMVVDSLNYISGYLKIVNCVEKMSKDELFQIFEYAIKRYGATNIIIDSLMRINMDGQPNLWEAQKDFVNTCTSFAKAHNVHVHLVAHPRKPPSQQGDGVAKKSDIAGTSEITDLADNVLIMERKYHNGKKAIEDTPDAVLHILKNREEGNEKKIPLLFNNLTKRYSEIRETGKSIEDSRPKGNFVNILDN